MQFLENINISRNRSALAVPIIFTWILSGGPVSAMDSKKVQNSAPVVPMVSPVVAPRTGSSNVPSSAPAAVNAVNATGSNPKAASNAASNAPATAVSAGAATAEPVAPRVLMTRDSQVTMELLQSLNPSGWVSGATKIFMPGIDASTQTSTLPALAGPALTPEEAAQPKTASSAPEFLPFEQLTSEVESDRVAILKEFRCNSVLSKNYKRGQRTIAARIYQFSNPESAYGAYSLLRQGASTVVRRGDASSEDDQGISFWQGRTFVSVYGTSLDDDESKDVVRSIADKFSGSLKEHASLPPILEQLPRLDIVKGSEHIVMGTLSAKRFSPLPYLNFLDFSHATAAATADYQTPPDRLKLLYIDFTYPGYASAAYRAYTANFAGRSVPLEEPLMGQTCLYKVNGGFILCQQVGGRLAIISGAKKKQTPAILARFLH